jgi:hypothetical protein
MPAKDLYCSTWFIKARRWAERHGDDWYILSAKHGLISPDQHIKPYNVRLSNKSDAYNFSLRVMSTLLDKLIPGDEIVFLAGKYYRLYLEGTLQAQGYVTKAPMQGLGIGKQLAWLTRNI